jgi:hypothetical protein
MAGDAALSCASCTGAWVSWTGRSAGLAATVCTASAGGGSAASGALGTGRGVAPAGSATGDDDGAAVFLRAWGCAGAALVAAGVGAGLLSGLAAMSPGFATGSSMAGGSGVCSAETERGGSPLGAGASADAWRGVVPEPVACGTAAGRGVASMAVNGGAEGTEAGLVTGPANGAGAAGRSAAWCVPSCGGLAGGAAWTAPVALGLAAAAGVVEVSRVVCAAAGRGVNAAWGARDA